MNLKQDSEEAVSASNESMFTYKNKAVFVFEYYVCIYRRLAIALKSIFIKNGPEQIYAALF